MSDSMLEALDKAFESLDSDATIRELKERLKEAEKVIEFYADVESYNLTHANQSKGYATNIRVSDHYYNEKAKRFFGGKKAALYQQKYTSEDSDE